MFKYALIRAYKVKPYKVRIIIPNNEELLSNLKRFSTKRKGVFEDIIIKINREDEDSLFSGHLDLSKQERII